MYLTHHGKDRIINRTYLRRRALEELWKMIERGAFVDLGTSEHEGRKYDYLLFYSAQDWRTKIAVLADNRAVLVSVWESSFKLPEGISAVNKRKMGKARLLYDQYVKNSAFSELVVSPPVKKEPVSSASPSPALYASRIEVWLEGKIDPEYMHDSGALTLEQCKSHEATLAAIKPHLEKIAGIVEANRNTLNGEVTYVILRSRVGALRMKKYMALKHQNLLNKLKAATL